ncbi:hypothetical protein M409DRAFT_28637 [Zasmidium cellare ATCC 36951]|uniref:ABM domain-containing protein n=1 Tax=Zasmidium cellare ATCC 36951 TaxID=1080233 RepID=A0A6A6C4C2_ZASCE|nr:uncharacterized protein M409DRAFT_28637 [Zasmidium cellare ATCC 36951]KAF2161030.1 hypothetical protein M409DRAFT_28637 [Zasmidium cellare ATCC 36951]
MSKNETQDPNQIALVAIIKPAEGKGARVNNVSYQPKTSQVYQLNRKPQFEELTNDYAAKVYDLEPGTLQFQLHKEEDGAGGRYCLFERYKSVTDLQTHRNHPLHAEIFKTFEKEGILGEAPTVLVGRAVGGHFDR